MEKIDLDLDKAIDAEVRQAEFHLANVETLTVIRDAEEVVKQKERLDAQIEAGKKKLLALEQQIDAAECKLAEKQKEISRVETELAQAPKRARLELEQVAREFKELKASREQWRRENGLAGPETAA